MTRVSRVFVVVGSLVIGAVPVQTGRVESQAAPPAAASRQPAATPAPRASLAILAGPRVDPRAIERFYNEAIVRAGNIDAVVQQLTDASKDQTKPKRYRANALFVRSQVQWRHGAQSPALVSADEGLAIETYDDFAHYKARLLDAMGRTDQAREWFQKALALTTNPQVKENIGLRLTFLDAIDSNVKGLVELARTRPQDFRNRAAVALGILDFNAEALELYQVTGQGIEAFRDHLRVAQWAIKANNAAKAQDHAWQAAQTAVLDKDRRYALSLLAEAYALNASLPKLLDRLAEKKELTRDEQSLRIELLSQTGQYQKAIDLFKGANSGELTPELTQELLRMYRDAAQDTAMIAEYRALMTREPTVAAWPEGLSQYYLEQGDQPNARKVWEEFLGRNTGVDALLLGSTAMTNFGLHELAMAAIEKALANASDPETAARVRLDQFELYRRRGMTAEAEATLVALDKLLPADSTYRTELADAFERIQKPQLAAKTLEALAAGKGGLSLDEKMRLAWLLDSIGRRDDALNVWRDLWNSETLAARRKLVAERLLMLAAELGTLGDLAVEIEEKLAKGTADPRDVTLLINIYTKVGDSVSAVETIATAASQKGKTAKSEVESLKEQAQVYLAMAEYQDFARITRRLLEIDPANRVDYLQQLLLNQIEKGSDTSRTQKDETAQLREYLDKLKDVGGEAVGTEFEAGVLELAGFRDLAIDGYRRSLARQPDRADDQLLLADLLRQAGRGAEAVASLQYIAESADTDELFLIAIDGITNMRTGGAATLKWAERRALERLTMGDDKLYLYEMLSDLAEEAKDAKVYASALENSLAHADSRRSYVLRELLEVTGEVTSIEASQRTVAPNPKLNVAYSRRLISLGEELPPEVFISLGRTFIRMNDPASARRAFRLAFDTTHDASVVLDAGKLFERGGFDKESITEYERALIASSGSIETMSRLARVRNRVGAVAPANDLYSRALLDIISRQNRAAVRGSERTPPVLESLVTFDYRKYYQALLAGFLSTLPSAPADRATKVKVFEDAFQDELRQVVAASGAQNLEALAYYPRLTVLSQALRTASYGAGIPASADRADAALLQRFGRDAQLVAQATDERARWGFAGVPGSAITPTAADRTMDATDYMKAVGVALGRNDQEAALASYRPWVRSAGLPKPPIRVGTLLVADRSPGIQEVVAHAWQRLDQPHFASFAQHVLGLVSDQDTFADRLLSDVVTSYETFDVPPLKRLETALNQPLIEEERLLGLVNKLRNWQSLNLPFVIQHVSPARQVDLLQKYLKTEDYVNWSKFFLSLGATLEKPLSQGDGDRLLSMLKTEVQAAMKRTNATSVLANITSYPMTAGMSPANAGIVEEFEQFLAEKYPQFFKAGYIKTAMLRDIGRDKDAVAAFVESALRMYTPQPTPDANGVIVISSVNGPTYYSYQSYVRSFAPSVLPKNRAEVLRVLDETEAKTGLTDALISLRVELQNNDPQGDVQQFLAAMDKVVERNPKNEQLLNILYPLYDQAGYSMKAAELLGRLVALRPENRNYRYRLVLMWQRVDYPEKAAEAAAGSTIDELNPVPPRPTSSAVMLESVSGPPTTRFPSLRKAVEAIKAAKDGGNPEQAALGLRTLLLALPPGAVTMSEFSQIRDADDPYLYFRDLFILEDTPVAPPRPAGAAPAGAVPAGAMTAGGTMAAGAAASAPPPPPPPPPAGATAAIPLVAVTPPAGAVAAAPVMISRVVSPSGVVVSSVGGVASGPGGGPTNTYDRLITSVESTANPADSVVRPPKLMDVIVKYPYAIAELESYIDTLRADDIDKQYVFYNWLIDAYVNNGRSESELTRRAPAVLAGTAGRKDVAVWLGIAARQPEASAVALARRADESVLPASALTGYQRLLLARLYVAGGLRDKAVQAYIEVANAVLAGTANTMYSNSLIADPFGRDNQLMLFTGIGLFDEVRGRLNADGISQFVTAMLALSKPSGSPALEQSFARFVIVLNARARQFGLTIPALQQAAGTLQVGPGWTRTEIVQVVAGRAQVGQIDDALRLLQSTMKRDPDTREPPIVATVSTLATRNYQIALGLTGDATLLGPLVFTPLGVEEFKSLFPTTANAWPGAREWVDRVAREVLVWAADRSINRDAAVQMLALVAIRLNQMGDTAAARSAAKNMNDLLRAGPVSIRTASFVSAVGDKVGAPVDLAILQEMVRNNRIHVSRVGSVLTRTVEAEGADKALQLGDVAARFTSADELLRQLITIARTAGNNAEVQKWTERQRAAAAARAALTRRPPGR